MADDKIFNTLEDVADDLISSDKKVHLIYAFNATGKTRLSTILKDKLNISENDEESKVKKILYFNAFTEDLFTMKAWLKKLEKSKRIIFMTLILMMDASKILRLLIRKIFIIIVYKLSTKYRRKVHIRIVMMLPFW